MEIGSLLRLFFSLSLSHYLSLSHVLSSFISTSANCPRVPRLKLPLRKCKRETCGCDQARVFPAISPEVTSPLCVIKPSAPRDRFILARDHPRERHAAKCRVILLPEVISRVIFRARNLPANPSFVLTCQARRFRLAWDLHLVYSPDRVSFRIIRTRITSAKWIILLIEANGIF